MSAPPDPAEQRHLAPVEDAPRLIVVNAGTGERVGDLEDLQQESLDQIAGLERDIRGWRARYFDLKRDTDAEAREDPLWPDAVKLFDYWKKTCKHPRSIFTVERFNEALPYLKKHGIDLCKRAVDGIAFDPFITTRKNGTKKRHDGWHLIFGKVEKFEECCNKAPVQVDAAQALPVE